MLGAQSSAGVGGRCRRRLSEMLLLQPRAALTCCLTGKMMMVVTVTKMFSSVPWPRSPHWLLLNPQNSPAGWFTIQRGADISLEWLLSVKSAFEPNPRSSNSRPPRHTSRLLRVRSLGLPGGSWDQILHSACTLVHSHGSAFHCCLLPFLWREGLSLNLELTGWLVWLPSKL